jgi:outer membrane protein assembly factor BamB
MASNDVTRRGVMKGVGVMTSARLAGTGTSGARRDNSNKSPEESIRSTVTPTKEWPQSGGTAARTGHQRGAIGPKSTVAYRWRVDGSSAFSAVAVADNIVYASDETVLRALSVEDGSEVWTATASDEYRTTSVSAPAVDDGRVYVGETRKRTPEPTADDSFDRHSRVLAFDAMTGEEVWQFESARTASGFHSPTVADGIVYIIGQNFGAGSVGLLYALDGATGDLLWKKTTGTSGIAGYEAPPVAVENGVVYLASEELFALDAQTGETYWSGDPNGTGTYRAMGKNAPAVANGRLYVGHGTQTTFEARHIGDGSHAWTHTITTNGDETTDTGTKTATETGVWTGAAVDDDTVYVGFNKQADGLKTSVYAFAADDGMVRWQTTFSDDRLPVHTPAIADGVLYTGGAALCSDDGSICWRLDSPTHTQNQILKSGFSPPAVVDETVYVGGPTLRAITGRT